MKRVSLHRPHTSAWFEQLMQVNPAQAMMTGATIRAVGHDRCCSTCGDEQAADYVLIEPSHTPTFRLCADCVEIRAGMFNEHYRPLKDEEAE
jgi:hypothetical protein